MKAGEDYRAQQEARSRLEDSWKAGQEAAMFRWRAEQQATAQVCFGAAAASGNWTALHGLCSSSWSAARVGILGCWVVAWHGSTLQTHPSDAGDSSALAGSCSSFPDL